MSEHEHPAHCRNCGSEAPGAYCPACGQETALHPPSAGEFLHEFVGHYVALEGALWRTVKALFVPGKLTLEYFAGRRRQYVLPLRLYLTVSLLFFVVVKVLAPQANLRVVTPGAAVSAIQGKADPAPALAISCDEKTPQCAYISERLKARYGEVSQQKVSEIVRDHLVAYAPYAMFFLLPLFALLTRAAYWRRPHNYGEHLVFAFHLHAFVFLVAIVGALAHAPLLTAAAAVIYLAIALARVFHGRFVPQALRVMALSASYAFLILFAVGLIATATLLL